MFQAGSSVGSPFVMVSNHGGHSPEQIAEMCVNRLLYVADTAPPELAAQVRAYREQLLAVVLQYVKMAVAEDRATVATKLEQSGMVDFAQQIRVL